MECWSGLFCVFERKAYAGVRCLGGRCECAVFKFQIWGFWLPRVIGVVVLGFGEIGSN